MDKHTEASAEASAQQAPQPTEGSQVGYGRPPETTRFKKGQSGNPQGHPRGSLNVSTVFSKTLREKVVINENGQRKTVTKLEAALKQLVNKAASGELRALRQLVELARDCEAKQNMPGAQRSVSGELDQEIIDGILERFQAQEEDGHDQGSQEVSRNEDQRN